jgi:hypothetical protein
VFVQAGFGPFDRLDQHVSPLEEIAIIDLHVPGTVGEIPDA